MRAQPANREKGGTGAGVMVVAPVLLKERGAGRAPVKRVPAPGPRVLLGGDGRHAFFLRVDLEAAHADVVSVAAPCLDALLVEVVGADLLLVVLEPHDLH